MNEGYNPNNEAIKMNHERSFSREEAMSAISRFAEAEKWLVPVRELSDDNGLYYVEAKSEGSKEGESIVYEFQRKGRFPNGIESMNTNITATYYEGDMPVYGETLADFDENMGEWKRE